MALLFLMASLSLIAQNESGELVINPDTVYLETAGVASYFNVKNETNETVTISSIHGNSYYLWVILPNQFTIQPGQSVDVSVMVDYFDKGYVDAEVELVTSIGNRILPVKINQEAFDLGIFFTPTHGLEFWQGGPFTQSFKIWNSNALKNITLTAIFEYGSSYFDIELQHELPYELAPHHSFDVTITLVHFPEQQTGVSIKVENSDQTKTFVVGIDEGLSVPKLTSETQLYPNPTTGLFTVEATDLAKVEVYNLVGQKVFETENGQRTTENCIDATNWNKGLYLVHLIDQNGVVETKKLVVR